MSKWEKLITKILQGKSDSNIAFDDLFGLLHWLGFDERTRGSHHLFRKKGVVERIILQKDKSQAKPYQVSQIREIIVKYGFGEQDGKI